MRGCFFSIRGFRVALCRDFACLGSALSLRLLLVFYFLVLVLGSALWCLVGGGKMTSQSKEGDLLVYCAAGFRKPMTEIARRYEESYGVGVNLQFGGSGTLASQLELVRGDLFLPADESYLESLREGGELVKSYGVAQMEAGLVVREGNPEQIYTLSDLERDGIKISLGDRSASIGKHTREVLGELGILDGIKGNVVVTKPTVNHVVEDVETGAVDVAIAWRAVSVGYSRVEWIEVPEFTQRAQQAELGVLKSSQNRRRALHFAEFVVAPDQGGRIFIEEGFTELD